MQQNPYEVLGIREGATQEEIKAAYRDQVKKYHPDKHADNPLQELAEEKLQEINEAYDILTKNPGYKHTGNNDRGGNSSRAQNNRNEFAEVRVNIDRGNIAAAEKMLANLPPNCAEWYFLRGMASLRKGWMDDAFQNIQTASAMEPMNFEYRQALNQLRGGGQQYRGGAYNRGYGNDDQLCKLCAGLACLDCMCDCI